MNFQLWLLQHNNCGLSFKGFNKGTLAGAWNICSYLKLFKLNNNCRHLKFSTIVALLVLCILSGLVGVAYLGFDPLVRSLVLKKLVLSNTSDTFHIWEDPPISPHLKVTKLKLISDRSSNFANFRRNFRCNSISRLYVLYSLLNERQRISLLTLISSCKYQKCLQCWIFS